MGGDLYYYNEGNFEKAIYHYRIAADSHGHPQALYNMGYMYQHGLGLKQDLHLAKRNFDKAMEVDADAAIAVTLSLIKLAFDYAFQRFKKTSSETITSENISKTVNKINVQEFFQSLLGDFWDIILGTLLVVTLGFIWAYRRQTRLLYEQQRMRELMRLQELSNVIEEDTIENKNEDEVLIENTDEIKVSDNDASPVENAQE